MIAMQAQTDGPFRPLDPSRRQIRLLHLDPDPSSLRAALEVVSLDDAPKYTALSYTWGTEVAIGPGIALGGDADAATTRKPITQNLKVVLEHLRDAADGLPVPPLWIDALCINQQDLAEKSHQITLMKDVYSRAEKTCIWLGPAADDSDLAMGVIGRLHGQGTYILPNDALSEAEIEAINALQRREWWSRIWVLQEAMLSPNPTVMCGSATQPFEAFVHLDDVRRGYIRPEARFLANSEGSDRFVIQGNPFRHFLTDYPEEKPQVRAGLLPLSHFAPFVDMFNATDPRDKIYGLLGLATPADVLFLAPDYTQSVADIYARATARFIMQTQSLRPLQFDNDHKNPRYALASWCPDYSSEPDWPQRGYIAVTGQGFDADGGPSAQFWAGTDGESALGRPSTDSCRELHLRGLDVDAVEYMGPNPYMAPYTGHVLAERMENVAARNAQTRDNVLAWERAATAKWAQDGFPYEGLGLEQKEAFWRTLMRNRRWDGSAVSSDYGRYFDAWLGRAGVDAAYVAGSGADTDKAEVCRTFVKPFTDCCISRCHGRSFVITKRGYIGLAPFETVVGDKVTVLRGGSVPFFLREKCQDQKEASCSPFAGVQCEFVGEVFVLGMMEGQAVMQATAGDVKAFIVT